MSYADGGKTIRCDGRGADGRGCGNRARVPVALRPRPEQAPVAEGWLFISGDVRAHYCPVCVRAYLEQQESPAAASSPAAVIVPTAAG